jgi:hypothetical protein
MPTAQCPRIVRNDEDEGGRGGRLLEEGEAIEECSVFTSKVDSLTGS